jgi:hypothetical protein
MSRVRRGTLRLLSAFALGSAMLLVDFGAAQALTGTSLTISHVPASW